MRFIVLVSLFLSSVSHAQIFTCDSIDNFFEFQKFPIEDDSANQVLDTFAKAVLYSEQIDLACAYNMLHEYFDKRNLRGESIRPQIDKALDLYDYQSFPRQHVLLQLELFTALFADYDIEKMEELADSIYVLYRQDTSVFMHADNVSMLSMPFSDLEKFEEAERIMKHAIELTDPQDSFNIFANHYRIALNLHQSANKERALKSALKGEPYLLKSVDDYIKGEFYTFLGIVYGGLDSMEMSAKYYHKALKYTDMPQLLIFIYRGLNDVHFGTDSATYYQNRTLALLADTTIDLQDHILREAYKGLLYDFYYSGEKDQLAKCVDYFEAAADTIHMVDKEAYWDAKMFGILLDELDENQFNIVNKALSIRDEQEENTLRESNRALSAEYEETLTKKENEKLRANEAFKDMQLSQSRSTILGGGLTLLILGVLSILLFRERNRQKRLNKEVTSQRNRIQILNQELNHRVKNNLAFVIALMQMQSRRAIDPEAKEVLKESEHRLMALSNVHASLRSGESAQIDISEYLSDIIKNLTTAFQSQDKRISVNKSISSLLVDADTAMRLGLIINELMTNSVKHVHEDTISIEINVLQTDDEKITLRYKDNGTGIEQLLVTNATSESMGLQLIKILRDQLKGVVDVVLV